MATKNPQASDLRVEDVSRKNPSRHSIGGNRNNINGNDIPEDYGSGDSWIGHAFILECILNGRNRQMPDCQNQV
jgi:hypothetical protein